MKSFNYFCPGSTQSSSGSSITTLQQYLTSIGKDNWYGIYEAGYEMYSNSDGSGGAVADGGAVGYWGPRYQVGFNHIFIQPTAGSRPLYSTTLSTIGPTISGDGLSWTLYLDSTTALNLDCSILMEVETVNVTGILYSQNVNRWSYYNTASPGTNNANNVLRTYDNVQQTGDALDRVENSISTGNWMRKRKEAISSGSATTRYSNAMRLFAASTGFYGSGRIKKIIFTPKLTLTELYSAVGYI